LMGSAPRVAPPVIQARLAEAMLPHDALGIVRTGEQKNLTDIRYDYKSQAFVSHGGGGNGHAEVVAHVGSGATGTANVQLGGHGSTVGSGGSHVSNGSSNDGSHGSPGGNGGGGHSGGTSSSAASSAASSSAASHH
jgi:hypothetical protein